MKKLTLNQAWTLCLKQWKWVIEQLDKGSVASVDYLKRKWLRQNDYASKQIHAGCFFCEYSESDYSCIDCPGRIIDPEFSCYDIAYNWEDLPRAFYRKLLELDKKRRAKK